MPASDLFYYSASIAFIAIAGLVAWVSVNVVRTLQSVKPILERADETLRDISLVKQTARVGIYSLIGKLIGAIDGR